MSNEHADLIDRLRKYEWGFRNPDAGEDWQWPAQCPLEAAGVLESLPASPVPGDDAVERARWTAYETAKTVDCWLYRGGEDKVVAAFAQDIAAAYERGKADARAALTAAGPGRVKRWHLDQPALEAARAAMALTREGQHDDHLKAKIQVAILDAFERHFSTAPPPPVAEEGQELAPVGWRDKVRSFAESCRRYPHKSHVYLSLLERELLDSPSSPAEGQET